MTAPSPARTRAVGAYGVTVLQVQQLVTDVAIPDVPDAQAPPNTLPISVAVVQGWIQLVSDDIQGRLFDATRITDTARRTAMDASIKLAVMLGTAAYVESAAHPATDGANSTTRASVLWTQSQAILTGLEVRIAAWVLEGGDVVAEPGVDAAGAIAGNFPPIAVPDISRW